MKEYKNFLPFIKIIMKVVGILIIIFLIYLLLINMLNPENINIKNSTRRKISEKIKDENKKKNNMYLTKTSKSIKLYGEKINDNLKNYFSKSKK